MLEAGEIGDDWLSAMWAVEPVGNSSYVRLRNRWREGEYIHTEGGWLQLGPINQDWASAMWWTLR